MTQTPNPHPGSPAQESAPGESRKPLMLLNTAILTADGDYSMRPVSLEEARAMVQERGFESAIGHEASARILSSLLGINCPVSRRTYHQAVDAEALVFRLRQRMAEGVVLQSVEEIEAVGYRFSLLRRHA